MTWQQPNPTPASNSDSESFQFRANFTVLKMCRIILFSSVLCMLLSITHSQLTFSNPILDKRSADPAILRVGNHYYLTLSDNGETELTIYKSPILTSFRNAETKVALKVSPPINSDLWASEMHEFDGEIYIYFTMRDGQNGHNMHVIKADNASNPMGNWSEPLRLLPGIDGTILKHNGQKYFVWTDGAVNGLSLYIARMESATKILSPYVLLRMPSEAWECNDGCLNEGPYFIYNRNVSFLVFSGSNTWDPDYSLSYISIPFEKDPMVPANWAYVGGPVFTRNDEEDVYNTGHAAFTVSPDLTETWMVYHGVANTTGRDNRIARIEKIEWNEDGTPRFPRPHGYNHYQPVPSGQTEV